MSKSVSQTVINMYQHSLHLPLPPWTMMGYAQETQHSQLTQWIQVFIYSLKFEDEVLLESCGHNIFIFFSRGHKKRPVNHKSCLVLSSYWCEANKDLTGLARFVVWFGLLGAVTVLAPPSWCRVLHLCAPWPRSIFTLYPLTEATWQELQPCSLLWLRLRLSSESLNSQGYPCQWPRQQSSKMEELHKWGGEKGE